MGFLSLKINDGMLSLGTSQGSILEIKDRKIHQHMKIIEKDIILQHDLK